MHFCKLDHFINANIFLAIGTVNFSTNCATDTALAGNTKGGSTTVPLTSCLTGLD